MVKFSHEDVRRRKTLARLGDCKNRGTAAAKTVMPLSFLLAPFFSARGFSCWKLLASEVATAAHQGEHQRTGHEETCTDRE